MRALKPAGCSTAQHHSRVQLGVRQALGVRQLWVLQHTRTFHPIAITLPQAMVPEGPRISLISTTKKTPWSKPCSSVMFSGTGWLPGWLMLHIVRLTRWLTL